MQIDQGNYGKMRFMSKQVSLPKISSILQKIKIGLKTNIRPFYTKAFSQGEYCRKMEQDWGRIQISNPNSEAWNPNISRNLAPINLVFDLQTECETQMVKCRKPTLTS